MRSCRRLSSGYVNGVRACDESFFLQSLQSEPSQAGARAQCVPNPLRGALPWSPFTAPRTPRCRSSPSATMLSTLTSGQGRFVPCQGAGLAAIDDFMQVRCAMHSPPLIGPGLAIMLRETQDSPTEHFGVACRSAMPQPPRGSALSHSNCELLMCVGLTATLSCFAGHRATYFF